MTGLTSDLVAKRLEEAFGVFDSPKKAVPTKEEVIEGLCFYRNVKIWREPSGGFSRKGWVVSGYGGYIQYENYPLRVEKKEALIYQDLFDAVLAESVLGAEVWAVDTNSEE